VRPSVSEKRGSNADHVRISTFPLLEPDRVATLEALIRAILSLLLVIPFACNTGGAAAVDAGPSDAARVDPRAEVCADLGSAAPAYSLIQRIFGENCTTCHAGSASMVDLSAGVSWANLVQRQAPSPDSCGGVLVVPGQPESSYLYLKLSEPAPCYGLQMPMGDFASNPLPACVVAIVRAWIAEGAPGPTSDAGTDTD
jgi:hypothetical protein